MAFPVFLQKASGVSLIVTLVAVLTFAFSVFSASEAAAPETAAASEPAWCSGGATLAALQLTIPSPEFSDQNALQVACKPPPFNPNGCVWNPCINKCTCCTRVGGRLRCTAKNC